MWFWKKKDKDNKKKDDRENDKKEKTREPDEHELMLQEMERELDRVLPGLGRMFREIEKELERTMPEMIRMMEGGAKATGKRPVCKGIHIVIGPDGVPRVREFGGAGEPAGNRVKKKDYKEPLVDVFDRGEEIIITAELPGVEKENVSVGVEGKKVEILAKDEGPFKYRKVLKLKEYIDPKRSRATFKNSILEITAKKSKTPLEGAITIS